MSLPGLGWWEAAQGARPETEDHPMTKRIPIKTPLRTRAKKKNATTSAGNPDTTPRPGGKLGLILSRLRTRGFAIRLEAKEGRKVYRLPQAGG